MFVPGPASQGGGMVNTCLNIVKADQILQGIWQDWRGGEPVIHHVKEASKPNMKPPIASSPVYSLYFLQSLHRGLPK